MSPSLRFDRQRTGAPAADAGSAPFAGVASRGVAYYYAPAFSRSGKRIAVDMSDAMNNGDVWIHDLDRPGATRVTLSPADESEPVWAPDDRRILFYSPGSDRGDVFEADLAATGTTRVVHGGEGTSVPTDRSRDGRFASLSVNLASEPGGSEDIWIHSFERGEASVYLATPFEENGQYAGRLATGHPGGAVRNRHGPPLRFRGGRAHDQCQRRAAAREGRTFRMVRHGRGGVRDAVAADLTAVPGSDGT
jgi:dipeptidyl aminopeptidase/acylaminoacyl peptidase